MKDLKFSHKIVVFDVETTGVNYWEHGIHQLAAMMVVDGEVVDRINLRIKPHPAVKFAAGALEVSGTTMDKIATFLPHTQAHRDFTAWLGRYINKFDRKDKAHLMGYNCAAFDVPFLRALFKQAGDEYFGSWFYPESLDVYVLAGFKLRKARMLMDNFQLHTVADTLEIPVEASKLHDAQYDLDLTWQIYGKTTSN